MQRISINNPQNIIDGTAKKYYFKLRNTGGPKGDKGEKGDTGSRGPQGEPGNAATIYVGSTTTLPVGQDATVENVGTQYNAVLNFGIPKGDRGPQGAKGDKGDTGAQGETGPRGPRGERGTNATVYVGTTSTLNPGSQATVYNSGTDSNAVLNFGIPQGAKGDTGSQGPQGPQGPTGPAGQNFAPTIVAELPTTGDESKLYLTPKAHTTQTATGNPITATVTEQAGALESFKLDGDTFQQSYNGSNLIDMPIVSGSRNGVTWVVNSDGSITLNGTTTTTVSIRANGVSIPAVAGETYTLSATGLQNIVNFGYKNADSGADIFVVTSGSPVETKQITAEMLSSANRLDMFISSGRSFNNQRVTLQLEKGSTATAYEPYVGGQPSPSPSYPQQIKTVTGTQTISINGTDYPLDLGSIELCKLGTYQDYIWKDGEDWKVHKATATITLTGASSENWYIDQYAYMLNNVLSAKSFSDIANMEAYCKSFSKSATGQTSSYAVSFWYNASGTGVRFIKDQTPDLSSFRSWLASNNQTVYYPLATATDTTITNANLIAQLEAIRTALLENGTNTITNTATGSNLAGDMEIGYYGYNPTNRYDKWLWLDLNNNYEQIGS